MPDDERTTAATNGPLDVHLSRVNGAAAELRLLYAERADAMQEAARAGATLEQIGRAAGVTRERVRHILAGHLKALDSAPHAGVEEGGRG